MHDPEWHFAYAVEKFGAGDINEEQLAAAVSDAIAAPIQCPWEYTSQLYRAPALLRKWIHAFPPDEVTIVELLQRIIERNIDESYQVVRESVTPAVRLLRLRPYLVGDHNANLRRRARAELGAYDPCIDSVNDVYPFSRALGEKYFGYRAMWHLLEYGPRELKCAAIAAWDTNRLDCTFTAAIDHYLWKHAVPGEGIMQRVENMNLAERIAYLVPLNFNDLPPELSHMIFEYTPRERVTNRFVCRLWDKWNSFTTATVGGNNTYMCMLAEHGCLSIIKWAYVHGCPIHECMSLAAAKECQMAALKWLETKGLVPKQTVAVQIPPDLRAWAEYHHVDKYNGACDVAARSQLSVLKYLRSIGCEWDRGVCFSAAYNNHLDILLYAVREDAPFEILKCMKRAAAGGAIEVLEFLEKADMQISLHKKLYRHAALAGYMEVLDWLYARGIPIHKRTGNYAAEGGKVKVLEWLYKKGAPWHKNVCAEAACHGRIGMIKWLYARGAMVNSLTAYIAAANGYLGTLQFIYDNVRDALDKNTCVAAASGGQIEILQWLFEHDVKANINAVVAAADQGHIEVLAYLHEADVRWNPGEHITDFSDEVQKWFQTVILHQTV